MLARESGGIQSALQEQVSTQRMGVVSALKCLYLLVKEEVAQHTKYGSLLALTKSIGCQHSLFLAIFSVLHNMEYPDHPYSMILNQQAPGQHHGYDCVHCIMEWINLCSFIAALCLLCCILLTHAGHVGETVLTAS